MRQVVQDLGDGVTSVLKAPIPARASGQLLIQTRASLVSAGTERMLVEFGRASMIDKARQQPERVAQVLDKMRTDGVMTTVEAVRSKLATPLPLGYCNAGVVVEVGEGVEGFEPGDRVVSNGPHAEFVRVPVNLCAKIPDSVSDDDAAFTVLAAVGLQGVRLAAPTIGEAFVVTGLGLVGLITVQILRANGCRVLGIDINSARVEMAAALGAETVDLSAGEDPVRAAAVFSRGRGVDGVIVTASTKSSEPIMQAAEMCRTRGRIVLVGVTGLELDRTPFYQKEITFQVSCSYGPGRYDPAYEEHGHDYPVGYVRWTEQRNFEAVLDMLAAGALKVDGLVTHRYPIADAAAAYDVLANDKGALGILLEYPHEEGPVDRIVKLGAAARPAGPGAPRVAVVGAGNYASRMLIPALAGAGASLHTLVSGQGMSAAQVGAKFGFAQASTDASAAIEDTDVDAVVIATRHDSHAGLVGEALAAGKHVFVEKPLALTDSELDDIEAAYMALPEEDRPVLTVGFNRRLSPLVATARRAVAASSEPSCFIATVNAGAIPPDHWTQDPAVGGGRLIGEGCHFIDLLRHLAGSPIKRAQVTTMGDAPGVAVSSDKVTVTLSFEDGSIGTVHYFANGHPSFPKERIEIFNAGRVLQIDNFRKMRVWGWKNVSVPHVKGQDKGHAALASAFIQAIRDGGPSPTPFDEVMEVSRCTVALAALRDGMWTPGER